MFAPDLFTGTTALVTGGGRGMGKARALGFARCGGNVIIASNEPDELKDGAQEIEAFGVGCLAVDVNIRDTASVERLRDQSLERFGGVDFVSRPLSGRRSRLRVAARGRLSAAFRSRR